MLSIVTLQDTEQQEHPPDAPGTRVGEGFSGAGLGDNSIYTRYKQSPTSAFTCCASDCFQILVGYIALQRQRSYVLVCTRGNIWPLQQVESAANSLCSGYLSRVVIDYAVLMFVRRFIPYVHNR